jgi:hypothetical protein
VSLIAMAMNLFAMFFFCVYPDAQPHQRGARARLAVAASVDAGGGGDLFLGKLLFYQPAAMLLAALLTLCYDARVLTIPFYWYTVWTVSMGFTGIGVVISCLGPHPARGQAWGRCATCWRCR